MIKHIDQWYLDRLLNDLVTHTARLEVFVENDYKNENMSDEAENEFGKALDELKRAIGRISTQKMAYELNYEKEAIKRVFDKGEEDGMF